MYKLLIVEDEKSTREGLRDCVDWCKYDIEAVAEVPNGQEALAFLTENPVDIVLTDVVMPIMDGTEFVRQIRQKNIFVKVIFVSGYWDMPYLKSAFELDAIDYILKPVKLAELEKVIQKAVGICNHESEEKKTIQEMKNKLAASMPALREQFVSEMLIGSLQREDIIEQRVRFLELPFIIDSYYTVFTIQINGMAEDGVIENMEQQEINRMVIKDITASILNAQYIAFCLTMKDWHISIILNSKDPVSYDEIIAITQKVQKNVQAAIRVQISIGIGEEVQSIGYLHRSYQKSLHALEYQYFLGEGKIIHYQDIDFENNIQDYYPHHLQERIFNAIRLGREQEVRDLVAQFFKEIQEYSGMRIEYIQTICLEFIALTGKLVMESSDIMLDARQRKDLLKEILRLRTLKETEEWMCSQLCDMARHIAGIQNQRSKAIIEQIKKVIQARYCDNITIQTLAQEFYLTPNYISMLFKKETGECFKEYLTRARMERVKTLMKDPSLKLYEIAEEVGYTDPEYFTKVFKKYTGVTPTEYRERLS